MPRKFHPRVLFGPYTVPKRVRPYDSEDEVLDAVRDRRKAMLFTGTVLSRIAQGDRQFTALLEAAFDRRLAVILDNDSELPREHREPNVYVLHLDQAWRVPALNALRATAFVEDGR